MLRLHLCCNQGCPTQNGRYICSAFAQIYTSMGTVASMTKTYYKKTQPRPKSGWFQGIGMLRLHLSCNQGGHTPSGRCICITFVQVCTFVGTVTTMTKTYYQKNITQTSNLMSLGLCNAHVAFKL